MSASVAAFDGYEQVLVPGSAAVAWQDPALLRLASLQATRRAVLFVRAAGDPLEPPDLADWFTERGFHFYVVGLGRARRIGRLWPVRAGRGPTRPSARWAWLRARVGGRVPAAALAGLDDACAHLRQAEGMAHVIVAAQGRGARVAALWSARQPTASALVLIQPDLPARPARRLSIACPVLVVTGRDRPARWRLRGHVTWLELPASGRNDGSPAPVPLAGRQSFFTELGRWLGAYMYGQFRDQLL